MRFVFCIFFIGCAFISTASAEIIIPEGPFNALLSRTSDLEQRFQAARAREQSTVNKLIGAVSIGATGIGAMQLASGLAEQKADENAEMDMRAYLETFRCDYGRGKNIIGGQVNIELPGGNEIVPLVAEYKALAADLKQRKDALGLVPGIESDVVLNSAQTGLYENGATGKTGGAYVSVARALSDENSEDAKAWNEQKDTSKKKSNTGAIVGGAGAAVGLVGNVAESVSYNKQQK